MGSFGHHPHVIEAPFQRSGHEGGTRKRRRAPFDDVATQRYRIERRGERTRFGVEFAVHFGVDGRRQEIAVFAAQSHDEHQFGIRVQFEYVSGCYTGAICPI